MSLGYLKNNLLKISSCSTSYICFVLATMACCFCITAEGAISKSVAMSLFLSRYSSSVLPYMWLTNVFFNMLVSVVYNKSFVSMGSVKIFILLSLSCSFVNFFGSFFIDKSPGFILMFYMWKDIFLVLAFQLVWSVVGSSIVLSKSKYLFCIFFCSGGIGSVAGGLITKHCSLSFTTEKLLLLTLPLYLIALLLYCTMFVFRENMENVEELSNVSIGGARYLSLLKDIFSCKLKYIAFLGFFMQISSTLMDYQFSTYLEKTFPIKDLRTQFLGTFFAKVNLINIFCQGFVSFVLVRYLGIFRTQAAVPLTLILMSIVSMCYNSYFLIPICFATVKLLDYSVFSITKEMLFVPLAVADKFQPKAFIDIFLFRGAKTLASTSIFILSFYFVDMLFILNIALLTISMLWVYIVLLMYKSYTLDRVEVSV